MAVSRSLRFKILTRDGFTCMYCGATPPTVALEVDHVIAESRGGTNDEDNLVTACFDCNRAKKAKDIGESLIFRAVLREQTDRFNKTASDALYVAELVDAVMDDAPMWGEL